MQCIVVCDYLPNVIDTAVPDLNCVAIKYLRTCKNRQYVYRLFIVALIGIKFCMYADTNVTIAGAKFPKHWFKNR